MREVYVQKYLKGLTSVRYVVVFFWLACACLGGWKFAVQYFFFNVPGDYRSHLAVLLTKRDGSNILGNATRNFTYDLKANYQFTGYCFTKYSFESYYTLEEEGLSYQAAGYLSTNEDATYISLLLRGCDTTDNVTNPNSDTDYVPQIETLVQALGNKWFPAGDVNLEVTGDIVMDRDTSSRIETDLVNCDSIAIPLALTIFAWAFMSLRFLVIPLAATIASLLTSFLIMYPVALHMDVVIFAPSLMVAVSLALSTDYSLFFVAVFRKEIHKGAAVHEAVYRMLHNSGFTILISGMTLTLCFLGLMLFPVQLLSTMGLGSAVSVVVTVTVSVSLTPSLLLIFPNFFRKAAKPNGYQSLKELVVDISVNKIWRPLRAWYKPGRVSVGDAGRKSSAVVGFFPDIAGALVADGLTSVPTFTPGSAPFIAGRIVPREPSTHDVLGWLRRKLSPQRDSSSSLASLAVVHSSVALPTPSSLLMSMRQDSVTNSMIYNDGSERSESASPSLFGRESWPTSSWLEPDDQGALLHSPLSRPSATSTSTVSTVISETNLDNSPVSNEPNAKLFALIPQSQLAASSNLLNSIAEEDALPKLPSASLGKKTRFDEPGKPEAWSGGGLQPSTLAEGGTKETVVGQERMDIKPAINGEPHLNGRKSSLDPTTGAIAGELKGNTANPFLSQQDDSDLRLADEELAPEDEDLEDFYPDPRDALPTAAKGAKALSRMRSMWNSKFEAYTIISRRRWYHLGRFILRRPFLVLLLVCGVAAYPTYQGIRFTWNLDHLQAIPRVADSYTAMVDMEKYFGASRVYPYILLMATVPNYTLTSAFYNEATTFLQGTLAPLSPSDSEFISVVSYPGVNYTTVYACLTGQQTEISETNCTVEDLLISRYMNTTTYSAVYVDVFLGKYLDPASAQGIDWIHKVRMALDTANAASSTVRYYLAQGKTIEYDIVQVLYNDFFQVVGITGLIVVLFIGVAFRSVVIPLRTVITLGMTIGFVYGLAVSIYEDNALSWLNFPGLKGRGALYWLPPILSFSMIVGLGLDYDVFLITMIVEYRRRGFSDYASILLGLADSGRIITAAGGIMAVAFFGVLYSSIGLLNQLAFFLGMAVVIDTFLTRTIVVPAIMAIGGRYNWWPRRMPPAEFDVDFEGRASIGGIPVSPPKAK